MSQLYKLSKQIHDLLPKVASKYDLEIDVESQAYIYSDGQVILPIDQNTGELQKLDPPYFPLIQAPQIRQILLVLKDVLGENPEYYAYNDITYQEYGQHLSSSPDGEYTAEQICDLTANSHIIFKSYAEVLCNKWLDGLIPLINQEAESVLSELVDVLENLLND